MANAIPEISGEKKIDTTKSPITKESLELDAFMEETVKVLIHESNEEGAIQMIPLTVQGTTQWIQRGVPQEVKRKYIEALVRSKTTKYVQGQPLNMIDERQKSQTASSYPYEVQRDTTKGYEWLAGLRKQP